MGELGTEDSQEMKATAEVSSSTEIREPQACLGRREARARPRKAVRRPFQPVGKLARDCKPGVGREPAITWQHLVVLRTVPMLGRTWELENCGPTGMRALSGKSTAGSLGLQRVAELGSCPSLPNTEHF